MSDRIDDDAAIERALSDIKTFAASLGFDGDPFYNSDAFEEFKIGLKPDDRRALDQRIKAMIELTALI